jgi:hypothetical protein
MNEEQRSGGYWAKLLHQERCFRFTGTTISSRELAL